MNKNTQKLLIVGHVWPQPKASAAGEHMMHLIQLFLDMNFEIHFASAAQQPKNYDDLDGLSITSSCVEINNDGFDAFLLEVAPSVVLFDRFMVEEQFSWRVKKTCPNALRILDTEDIHFLRKQRQEALKGKKQTIGLTDTAKRELASIYRCDLSLIISQVEMQMLIDIYEVPEPLLMYLPLLSDNVDIENTFKFEEREDLIFVGNFLHEPNWQAIQVLKQKIWPLVRKENKSLKMNIYGAYASDKHKQLNTPKEHFYVHGYVEDLNSVIEKSKLLIAPLYFGAGQKGKLLKAMQCGTPSVTTSIGAEAMQFNKTWPGLIQDAYEDFAKAILELYSNKALWEQKQKAIPLLVNDHFQYNEYLEVFKSRIVVLQHKKVDNKLKNITGELLWHHSMRSTEFMSRWIMEKNK